MKAFLVILLTIFNIIFNVHYVLAVEAPNFPSCNKPSGVIKVQYNEGTHGIAGDGSTYTGKDTVYELDSDNLQQCFCSTSGQGIQTNWWRISSLDENQQKILRNLGWKYIPNGALWGLKDGAYMAQNSNYTCTPGNSGDNGTGGGEITREAASAGQVLGLAYTGNSIFLLISFLTAVIFLSLGIIFHKKAGH
ncbi:MAG: hypothetical protein PHQ59_03485 [Candidatus Daviesbacteria bacterium]|nr:hypothetical protein [Candidatus Daviesbacteria bacterium]